MNNFAHKIWCSFIFLFTDPQEVFREDVEYIGFSRLPQCTSRMIICLGPICIPLWGLLPFLMIVFKKVYTWVTGKEYDDGKIDDNMSGDLEAVNKKVAELAIPRGSSADSLRHRHKVSSGVEAIGSKEEWIEVLAKAKLSEACVFAKFTAEWCGPCKKISPVFEELSVSTSRGFFVEIDVDKNAALAKQYGISSMPTFLVLKNTQKTDELLGANETKLRELVDKHITD
eukprot:m.105244 g.105244  ORF g.105244 m.105244 type:complete len:228 (-) comp16858_c0_seq1:183-866(-)